MLNRFVDGDLARSSMQKLLTVCFVVESLAVGSVGAQTTTTTYPPLGTILQLHKAHLTIGAETTEGPDLFGAVRAVTMDTMKNVFVLDPTVHAVRAFAPDGKFVAAIGRAGRGPGDLADPLALAHDGKETLYVVDRYNGINVFSFRQGMLVYRSRFGAELSPTSACVLGDTLVVAGVYNDQLLHLVSGGKVARSFGSPFHTDANPVVREVANSGRLVVSCDVTR